MSASYTKTITDLMKCIQKKKKKKEEEIKQNKIKYFTYLKKL